MSGSFDDKSGFTYILGSMDSFHEAIISSMFDEQVSYDIAQEEEKKRATKLLKRICLMKLITCIPDIVLTSLLLNRDFVKDRLYCNKLYWMFIRNHITEETLKAGLKLTKMKGRML